MTPERQLTLQESKPLSLDPENEVPFLKERMLPKEEPRQSRIDPRIISDATIGLSDGLTVPFALTAGLSAFGDTRVVILGGLAELIAGMISMGVGGYLGSRSEVESYESKLKSTRNLIRSSPTAAKDLIRQSMDSFDLSGDVLDALVSQLTSSTTSQERQLDFIMKFSHEMQSPASNRAYISAVTIAIGYFVGGFIPLIPYFFAPSIQTALWWSIGFMAVALFSFGFLKRLLIESEDPDFNSWSDRLMGRTLSAVEMVLLGGMAAGAAMGLVRALNP